MDEKTRTEKKYSEFKRMNYHNAHKYRRNPKKIKKFVLWPFVVIIPIFILGLFSNTIMNQIQGQNNSSDKAKSQKIFSDEQINSSIEKVFSLMVHKPNVYIRQDIQAHSIEFQNELLKVIQQSPSELLLLVDKNHSLSKDFIPNELIQLDLYDDILFLNKRGMEINKLALESLIKMSSAAQDAGIKLIISSVYRSYQYQTSLFDYYIDTEGLQEAEKVSARPGASQHQLGLAIDLGSISNDFVYTEAGKWVEKNAAQFGFSLSYPPNSEHITGYVYESWHYRYVGNEAAKMINEYFDGFQQYFLEFIHYIPEDSILLIDNT